MAEAYLGLGANLGDRDRTIEAALVRIAEWPETRLLRRSRLYRTPPWGDPDQGEFLNAVATVDTALAPHALLDRCLATEAALGRVRERRWGPRAIDIDILHMPGVTLDDARLTLPHPLWRERAFVLVPLAEIARDLVIEGVRVEDALRDVDASGVEPLKAPVGRDD